MIIALRCFLATLAAGLQGWQDRSVSQSRLKYLNRWITMIFCKDIHGPQRIVKIPRLPLVQ